MPIADRLRNVSFDNGKFLSDKSYAYDTIYFVSKFIRERSSNNIFYREINKDDLMQYIGVKFTLTDLGVIRNYYNETLNVLLYSDTIEKIGNTTNIRIIDEEVMNYISSRKMENAYVYLYLLCYFTLKNSDLLDMYEAYLNESNDERRKSYLDVLGKKLQELNVSTKDPTKLRSTQCQGYILSTLNFINNGYKISKQLNEVKSHGLRNPFTISLNTPGSKTVGEKNNAYLNDFDFEYVENELNGYLFI